LAEDVVLSAVVEVTDKSQLEDLTANVSPEADGGASAGGGGGGAGGLLDILGNMSGLLKVATVALGVLAAVPGLLSGVLRLLEVALLPIGILFQSLLAPLIQRLLKFLVQNDVFGAIQRFASSIVSAISNFVADLQPLIDSLSNFVNPLTGGENQEQPQLTNFEPTTGVGGTVQDTSDIVSADNPGFVVPAISEFSASVWDEFTGEASNGQTQEEGPS